MNGSVPAPLRSPTARHGLPPALVALAVLLAGCSGGAASVPDEIIVESAPPEETVTGEGTPVPAVFTPSPKTRGHLAGVVVDQAIRPIEGAIVRLPGLDLERTTDRDGSFGFVDLHPGPYFLTVNASGYYAAEAVLEVDADEFTRAKVILTPIPPPEPYHVTQSFRGFADLSDSVFGFGFLCGRCDFDFYLDHEGLKSVVLEAVLEGGTESNGFYHDFGPYECCGSSYSSGEESNPMLVTVRGEDVGQDERYRLDVYPTSFPAPELSRRFDVYVTAFYNEPAPTGWSIVAGSQ